MPPGGMQVLTYDQPKTGLEAKFSLQFAVAAAKIAYVEIGTAEGDRKIGFGG